MPDGTQGFVIAKPQSEILLPQAFPPDIQAEIDNLIEVLHRTREIAHDADGKWFGFIGWDAVAGLIPGIGAIYSTYKQFQLQSCAGQARCGFGTRFMGFMVGAFDIGIGLVMGFGDLIDIFLRSSAIFGNAIEREIERKLIIAQNYRERGDFSPELMQQLRDALFHGGQDAQTRQMKLIGGLILLGVLLYSCGG